MGTSIWKLQPNLSLSYEKTKSEADFDKGFPVPHVGIIVEILRATSNLNVITSFSGEATLIFLLAEAVDFFGKSWVWSGFILIILFYTSVFNVC